MKLDMEKVIAENEDLFGPIEVKLPDGETVCIEKVVPELLDGCAKIAKAAQASLKTGENPEDAEHVIERQLGILFGEDHARFGQLDARVNAYIFRFTFDTIVKQLAGKGDNEVDPTAGAEEEPPGS